MPPITPDVGLYRYSRPSPFLPHFENFHPVFGTKFEQHEKTEFGDARKKIQLNRCCDEFVRVSNPSRHFFSALDVTVSEGTRV